VERTSGAGPISHLEVLRQADAALAGDVVDVLGIAGDTADAQTLVVDLVPVALTANTVDGVETSDAAALSVGQDLINSTSNHTETTLVAVARGTAAGSSLGVEGGVSGTLGASTVDDVVGGSAVAAVVDAVEDLVGKTGNSADVQSHVEEGIGGTGLAGARNQEVALGADALLVHEVHVWSALAGGDGERLDGSGSVSGGNAVSGVESVALDAVAFFRVIVVDGVGGAAAALSVDVVEAGLAEAGEGVEVQHLVEFADWPTDGQLCVVVVGSSAVGAGALDDVEAGQADADSVDQLLVEGAGGREGGGLGLGRVVGESAGAVEQSVSGDALAGEGGQVVGGVGRADVADCANEVESLGADASTVLVDLVLDAGGSGVAVSDAVGSVEVVADDADTLAEDVIIDLVEGTGDLYGCRSNSGLGVGGSLSSGSDCGGIANSEGIISLLAIAVDVYVALILHRIVGEVAEGSSLRVERHQQQREEEPSRGGSHLLSNYIISPTPS
jgi:hypothetical protein